MGKQFNDPEVHGEDNYWPSVRLADLREVGRRFQRTGMREVRVDLDRLTVRFYDPVASARVALEMEPMKPGVGWYWYGDIIGPKFISLGALVRGRRILASPWPREVVRAYLAEVTYERRSCRKG
jgi:hypothetical protein